MSGGFTVPGGSPQMLRQLATQLLSTAQGFGSLGSYTGVLTKTIPSDAEWTGDASDGFQAFSANLGKGASAAQDPLQQIAGAVENYAGVLETAQTQAQYANEMGQAASAQPALLSAAEQAGLNASNALEVLQQAEDQAARLVTSAASDLQLQGLFGGQGPVTTFVSSQPVLSTNFLWKGDTGILGQLSPFDVDEPDGPSTLINTGSANLPTTLINVPAPDPGGTIINVPAPGLPTGLINTGSPNLPSTLINVPPSDPLIEYNAAAKPGFWTRTKVAIALTLQLIHPNNPQQLGQIDPPRPDTVIEQIVEKNDRINRGGTTSTGGA